MYISASTYLHERAKKMREKKEEQQKKRCCEVTTAGIEPAIS
jgi:hypothetical protein